MNTSVKAQRIVEKLTYWIENDERILSVGMNSAGDKLSEAQLAETRQDLVNYKAMLADWAPLV